VNLIADALRLAVGTLTVLPVRPPRSVERRTAALAMLLAPVAVLPLAAVAALVVWAGAAAVPPLLTGVLAVGALALGSGGLHLDGLADSADGLGVPGDRERALAVMRTGDVGPLGAAALVLVMVAQASALAGLVSVRGGEAALTVGLAVVVSRGVLALTCTRGVPAARADGLGSAVAGAVPATATVLLLLGLGSLGLAVSGVQGVAAVVAAAAVAVVVLVLARRRFGGVTGDVLGACVELALTAALVVLVVRPGVG